MHPASFDAAPSRCSRENPRARAGRERASTKASTAGRQPGLRYATHTKGGRHEDRTRLPAAHRHPHRGPVDPGRDRLRQVARPAHGGELQGSADVAAAALGRPRQPRARQRGRELRAVRRGRAGRQRGRLLDTDDAGLRRRVLLRSPRPRHRPHQRHRPAEGADDPVHDRLDRVPRLCHRRAGPGRCDVPTSGLAPRKHSVTLEKQLGQSEPRSRA